MKSYSFALVGALTAAAVSVSALEADALKGHGAMRRHHDRAANQSLEKRAYNGHATYYNVETGNAGSCGNFLKNSDFTVAVTGTMMNSGLCGKMVTISANGKTTQARIVDTCPPGGGNCGGPDLDLSPALFQFFNPLGVGKFSINWSIGGGGGGSSNSGGGGGGNNNDNGPSQQEKEAAAAAAAAAARKKAAEEKAQAAQDKKDAAAASSASVSAAARASSASESRASRASVASESRASVAEEKSASRASASAEAKASASIAAELKEEERTRPKNIENFGDILHGITDMVNQAKGE